MKLVIDSNILVSSLDPKDIFYAECYPLLEKMLSLEIKACGVIKAKLGDQNGAITDLRKAINIIFFIFISTS